VNIVAPNFLETHREPSDYNHYCQDE